MEHPLLKFHHFGLAVRRRQEGERFLLALGYQIGETVFDSFQNVRLAMCHHHSQPAVELISPGEGPGPIDTLLQRNAGGIVYHVCYETTNLTTALASLTEVGIKVICISPPQPAPLFHGLNVSFYNIIGLGLVEILESNAGSS